MQSKRLIAILSLLILVVTAQAQVGQWVYKAHMLHPRKDCAAVTGNDGKIYVFGDDLGSPFAITAEAYDPDTDTWSPISSMPSLVNEVAAIKLPDGRILLTGRDGSTTNRKSLIYAPQTDTYTDAASPTVDSFPYVAGALGSDGNVIALETVVTSGADDNEMWSYDLQSNAWVKTSNPMIRSKRASAAADVHGLIYFSGGSAFDTFALSGQVWTYDDHTHAWNQVLPLLKPRTWHASVAGSLDGRIYDFGGGTNNYNETFTHAEFYDPAIQLRSIIAPLQVARREHAGATDKYGRIYAIGGLSPASNTPGPTLDTVECYRPFFLRGTKTVISPVEGAAFSGGVGTFNDLAETEPAINYSASISWGDGNTSVGFVSDGATPKSFVITGTHTYAKEGFYSMSINIDDSDGDHTTISQNVHVTDAPINGSAIDFSASSGVAFTRAVVHFDDANSFETAADFDAIVDWGDGSAPETESVTANASGGFDVRGDHTYATAGTYSFVAHTAGKSFSGTATVTPPAPVVLANGISGVEGSLFTGKVATFNDADPNVPYTDFTAAIEWGDGSTSAGIVGPDFTVKGSHTYVKFGLYTLKVTVTIQGGASHSSSDHANISNAAITASGFNLTSKSTSFKDTIASFTDGNPFGVAGDYSAAIFWGDGKSSVGTIVAAGGGFKVVGSHAYAKKGKYVVTVSIKDQGGATASATTQVNVGPVK